MDEKPDEITLKISKFIQKMDAFVSETMETLDCDKKQAMEVIEKWIEFFK